MNDIPRRLNWFASTQLGIDVRRMLRFIPGLIRYLSHLIRFRAGYKGRMVLMPCLHDWFEEGGGTRHEYFWQDLHVARKIFDARPERHVDIGSRVDGFVAHLASFREVEVFDIRPITSQIPGIRFRQADLMQLPEGLRDYCDSLSCLHALEHFGLGRYGDPIDVEGYAKGLASMAKIVRPGGLFYLAVPVGLECVAFNGHRVLDPRALVSLAAASGLGLQEFAWVENGRTLIHSCAVLEDIERLASRDYALGIFTFRRKQISQVAQG